jgi:hypothetical protein
MKNLVPLPYRRVSVQPYESAMTEAAIRDHLIGKETYRRTDFVVLTRGSETAVVAVSAPDREALFCPIDSVELVSLPDTTRFVGGPRNRPLDPLGPRQKGS